MTDDPVKDYLTRLERARQDVTNLHDSLTDRQRRARLLVEYHCAASRPCLLLRIFATEHGPAFYRPPYILTEERNLRRSNEEGRAANTTDGFNHWGARCNVWTFADGVEDSLGWPLNCRHVDVTVRAADIDADIRAATPGAPTRRRVKRTSSEVRLVVLESVSQLV